MNDYRYVFVALLLCFRLHAHACLDKELGSPSLAGSGLAKSVVHVARLPG